MKTSKRDLALLMIAAMTLFLAPAPAFAATETLTAVYYWGVNQTNDSGSVDDVVATSKIQSVAYNAAASVFDATLAANATIDIPVAFANLATFKSKTTVTGTASTFVRKASPYTFDGTKNLAAIAGEGTPVVYGSNSVAIGDYVLIVATGENPDQSKLVILHIVQDSSGTIEGVGTPEKVAFDVVVPLAVDFVLDPGELNIENNQIFGADYSVTNKTPNYAVQLKFDVVKKSDASTIANLLPGTAFTASTKQSKINVVNAASVTLNGGNTAFEKAIYESNAVGQAAKELDIKRRTVAVGAAAAGTNASAPVSTVFVLDKYGTTDAPASALSMANVGAFTFRGALNEPDTLTYSSGDVKVTAKYTLTGVGTTKYAKEAPIRVGAGAKPFAVEGYGFVATTNAPSTAIQNSMWLNPDNGSGYAGHTTLTYTAAQATAGTVYIGMDLPAGTTVDSIWFGEVGAASSEFTDETALFDLTGATPATRIKLNSGWSAAATDRTFEFYIVLNNGETWAVTVNANA